MTKTHLRGRYAAALRLAVMGLRTVELSLVLAGVLLVACSRALALDPALDVSQYAHTAWKIRDGFTKGAIYAIAQTPDGYLWLGTEFGLYRFDGVRAVPWQPPRDQHLPPGRVAGLLTSRDGTLWIGTDKGLASWKSGKLTQYPELAGQEVLALFEDRKGTVWVGGIGFPTGRLCAIQNGSVLCRGDDGVLGHGVVGLYEDSEGNLWAGVENALWRWMPGPPKFYPLPGNPNGIQALGEDNDGTLLLGWNGGIHRFVDGKAEVYPLPELSRNFEANRLLRDRDGGLWIGTNTQGLVHEHDGRTDLFAQLDGLSDNGVQAFFEDREGNIWVATNSGLDRFRNFAVATLSVNQGLSGGPVDSVLADKDGSVWVGTHGGLSRWNNGKITILRKRRADAQTTSNKPNGRLNGDAPDSLFQGRRGRIWVSTFRGLGYVENKRFAVVSAVPGGNVHSIVEDNAGNLWIANQQVGLLRFSTRGEVLQIPWAGIGHKDPGASALAADPLRGGLWIGFYDGAVAYFNSGGIRESYSGVGDGYVNGLQVDRSGTLWAATEGGLSRLKNGRIATLTSKNGLPCDAVYWVIEDDIGSLWLKMSCGLVRIARSELDAWAAAVDTDKDVEEKDTVKISARVFDSSDGVRTEAYALGYSPKVTKSLDGRLWFVGVDGVSLVDPKRLSLNTLPPPVHIEQITADRKIYQGTSDGSGRVALPALVRDLEIDYTALSLVAPEKVRFRYRLEGRDRDWQDAGNRRQAFYSDLPPRNYRFRVMACNNSGVWNETGAYLDFSVAPAYYQTTWFRLSSMAAFLALVWGLYQLRLRQLAREFNAGLEARVNERTRIARELHDSLLQGFQGMMFRLQAVRDLLPGRPSEAVKALEIALERGDKAIAEGRDTVSDLRESIVGDKDLAEALTALGEELTVQSDNGAVPGVRVLIEGKPRELNPMLRDEIYRIGREALRNAFRHARAQKIEAEITYGDSEFVFHVRDDGVGIDPAVANQGARAGHWGLPGMRERAKNFGGKLELWSERGAGTEIELSVPAAIAYGKSAARRRFWSRRKED